MILLDIRKDFQVYCDASRLGLGGVLMQDGRVVSYASHHMPRKHQDVFGFEGAFLVDWYEDGYR